MNQYRCRDRHRYRNDMVNGIDNGTGGGIGNRSGIVNGSGTVSGIGS